MEEENKLEQSAETVNNEESVASNEGEQTVSVETTVEKVEENTTEKEETSNESEVKSEQVEAKVEETSSVKPPKKSRKEIKEEKEKAKLAEYEGLSDDELYTKLQTEKMLKRKRNSRIASIVGLCTVFALAVVIIVLAVVPVSLVPQYLKNDFVYMSLVAGETDDVDGVVVKLNKANTTNTLDTKQEFEKFKDLFDKSFTQTYISAIFSGNLSKYEISETWKNESTVLESLSNKYIISLDFKKDQEFTYSDGAKYTSKYAGTLKFKKAYVSVNETEGFQDTKIYIVANNYVQNGETVSKVVEVTIRANTFKIFEQWNEFIAD